MTTEAQSSLRVHIQELPARTLVCLTCQLDQASGHFSTQIAEGFEQVKRWLEHHDQAVADHPMIGIPHIVERQLIGYECCVEPAHIAPPLPQGWQTNRSLLVAMPYSRLRKTLRRLESESDSSLPSISRSIS